MPSSSRGNRSLILVAAIFAVAMIAGPAVTLYFLGDGEGNTGDGTPDPDGDTSFLGGDGNDFDTGLEPATVTLEDRLLHVNGEAMPILQCVRYQPTPPGKNIEWGYRWAHYPENWQGDLGLLENLGVNVVVVNVLSAAYPSELSDFMTAAHERGIWTILEVNGPNRQDASRPEVREGFLQNVTESVETFRDHPALLMWQLGNEVDHMYPDMAELDDWYTLLGQATDRAHELDPNHPVLTASTAATPEHWFRDYSPQVDVYGSNFYGLTGEDFGTYLGETLKELPDHPILITEFGVDAWDANASAENETAQADLLLNVWEGIAGTRAKGEPVLGACVHEWSDQWWKDGNPDTQSPDSNWTHPTHPELLPDGQFHEEYFGLVRVSPDSNERGLREAYHALAEAWGGAGA